MSMSSIFSNYIIKPQYIILKSMVSIHKSVREVAKQRYYKYNDVRNNVMGQEELALCHWIIQPRAAGHSTFVETVS